MSDEHPAADLWREHRREHEILEAELRERVDQIHAAMATLAGQQ